MDPIEVIVLALVQGITEFLPISSSAHLILLPRLVGWADHGLALDLALHFGTLIASLLFFRREVSAMASGHQAGLLIRLALSTAPVILMALWLQDAIETQLRAPWVICTTTLIFALVLWYADRRRGTRNGLPSLGAALLLGMAQALALIPGTSRSGVTLSAALLLGYQRLDAARYTLLMAVPVILLATLWKTLDLLRAPIAPDWGALALGTGVSALAAYACLWLFIGFLERIGLMPFVVYRLALGALLFALFI